MQLNLELLEEFNRRFQGARILDETTTRDVVLLTADNIDSPPSEPNARVTFKGSGPICQERVYFNLDALHLHLNRGGHKVKKPTLQGHSQNRLIPGVNVATVVCVDGKPMPGGTMKRVLYPASAFGPDSDYVAFLGPGRCTSAKEIITEKSLEPECFESVIECRLAAQEHAAKSQTLESAASADDRASTQAANKPTPRILRLGDRIYVPNEMIPELMDEYQRRLPEFGYVMKNIFVTDAKASKDGSITLVENIVEGVLLSGEFLMTGEAPEGPRFFTSNAAAGEISKALFGDSAKKHRKNARKAPEADDQENEDRSDDNYPLLMNEMCCRGHCLALMLKMSPYYRPHKLTQHYRKGQSVIHLVGAKTLQRLKAEAAFIGEGAKWAPETAADLDLNPGLLQEHIAANSTGKSPKFTSMQSVCGQLLYKESVPGSIRAYAMDPRKTKPADWDSLMKDQNVLLGYLRGTEQRMVMAAGTLFDALHRDRRPDQMRAIFWTIDRLGIRFRDPEFRIERTQFNALSSLIERLSVGNARSRDSILGTLSTFDRAKDMTTYLTEWGSPDEHTKSKAERKAKGARQQDED